MIKAVLTGTSHSGKTSLLEALGREGYKTVPEAETQIVQELVREWGAERTREWIKPNYFEFKKTVGERQAQLESEVVAGENEVVIYDRSAICWIAYCRLRNSAVPPILEELAVNYRFQHVFFCERLSYFGERSGEGRIMKKEEAIMLNDLIAYEYRIRGYNPIRVPEVSPNKELNMAFRVGYIKQTLQTGSVGLTASP